MEALSEWFGSGELGAALLALMLLDGLFLAWLAGRSRRRAGSSLVDGAQKLGWEGRSSQRYLALRFR